MAKHDNAVGKYVYLTVNGIEYRVYYECAGEGIPLVCQHTAGAHGFQWRHLLEDSEITKRFRVIAWDLPFHGKSLPPVGDAHWTKPYNLTRDFFLKFITIFCTELALERPVFMGCSMGGQVAVDLAAEHGDKFRAVIGVESSLTSPGYYLDQWYHPRISNEAKPATMFGLCAPTSPEKYVRETVFGYSQGAPMVFKGDLYYYSEEYDGNKVVDKIDTRRSPVYFLTGEYDFATSPDMTQALAARIKGSKFTEMKDNGHFPMSENPVKFLEYLKPILNEIAGR
ncbi:MAG: alpha/beta hydrolase [Gammaproteobacteria bacterium]|nr:alpha/beta hydrolase [Gammaproteobacteria bacterium]